MKHDIQIKKKKIADVVVIAETFILLRKRLAIDEWNELPLTRCEH